MFRTWSVRLPAIEFTLSVRSFHVPETPCTCGLAAELALGADLLGDARDLGGERESWSTIVLIVFFSSRISPLTSTVIFFDRSPFATAVVTCGDVSHLVGQVRRP